jgi:hypothetical protein
MITYRALKVLTFRIGTAVVSEMHSLNCSVSTYSLRPRISQCFPFLEVKHLQICTKNSTYVTLNYYIIKLHVNMNPAVLI